MTDAANRTPDGKEVPFITVITIPEFFEFKGSMLNSKYIDLCEFISHDRHIIGKFLNGKMIQGVCHFFDSPQHKVYFNNKREVLYVKNGIGRYYYMEIISGTKHFIAMNTDSIRYYITRFDEDKYHLIFETNKSYTMYYGMSNNRIKSGALFNSDFPGRQHWINFVCHYKIATNAALNIERIPFTIMKYDIYNKMESKSSGGICVVCHEVLSNYMFNECRHLCICASCYDTLDQKTRCVLCRVYTTCSRVYL